MSFLTYFSFMNKNMHYDYCINHITNPIIIYTDICMALVSVSRCTFFLEHATTTA